MPLIPVAPPVQIGPAGGFDYVTVDAAHRRMYAAHGDANSLVIVDADTGKLLGQVKVGPMAGVAVNPANGHVFTGNGEGNSVSEVDPVAQKVLRTVHVQGHVDAIQYDTVLGRIYADEDDGTRMFVIDAKTFKEIKAIPLPGHKPEYLQVDPQTHNVYQNIANMSEIAVIDQQTLTVSRTFATPEIKNNHPLQLDAAHGALLVGGENNVLSVYSTAGKKMFSVPFQGRVDQCDFDASRGWLACAGKTITLISFDGSSAPKVLARVNVSDTLHTLAIDKKTGTIFTVFSDSTPSGKSYVQRFTYKP